MAVHGGPPEGGSSQGTKFTPRDPLPVPWGNPVGNGDPDVDDQEVTFLRGGGWGSRGQPPWPPAPTQPDEDVGHLINTLATRLQLGTPHINTFSGKAMLGKMEVFFEQWYHEVQCVKDHYPELVVWESIVQLLKGQWQIWPGTWALPPAWPIFYKN